WPTIPLLVEPTLAGPVTNTRAFLHHLFFPPASAPGGPLSFPTRRSSDLTGTVALTSDASLGASSINGNVVADTVKLTSSNGSIGPLSIAAHYLQANAAQGNVNITDTYTDGGTNTVTLLASGAKLTTGTFFVEATAAGTLTNSGAISAHEVDLTASASGGAINLQNTVTGTSTGTVALTSDASLGASSINAHVLDDALPITSSNGSIGPLSIAAHYLQANAAQGNVNITDTYTDG